MPDDEDLFSATGEPDTVLRVFEALPFALGAWQGHDHVYVATNAAYRALLGRGDLLGRPVREAVPELEGQQFFELLDRVAATGVAETAKEWRMQIDTDGSGVVRERYFDFTVAPCRDPGCGVAGLLFFASDVTDSVLARHVAEARAQLMSEKYEQARDAVTVMQQALLAPSVPVVPGAEVAAAYLVAAEDTAAGGDWFDALALPGGELALITGDVVGHGVEAAAVMGQLRAVLRQQILAGADVAGALSTLDAFSAHVPGARTATVCVAVLDTGSGRVRYCTGGHPPPLVASPVGTVRYLPPSGATPIGTGSTFPVATDALATGDVVLLYTDGLIERPGRPPPASTAELAERAALSVAGRSFPIPDTRARTVDRVCGEVLEFLLRETGYSDDVTIVAAQRTAMPDPLHVHLHADREAPKAARSALWQWLVRIGADHAGTVAVEHAVSELVSNVVERAYPGTDAEHSPVEIGGVLDADGCLRIRVRDRGRWKTPATTPESHRLTDSRGRGLTMVRLFADDLRIDCDDTGTTATVTFRLTRSARVVTEFTDGAIVGRPESSRDFAVDETAPGRLAVRGDVDIDTAPILKGHLDVASRGGTLSVTVDLSEVTHLGSAGVSLLSTARERAAGQHTAVTLVAPPGTTAHHVLTLVGLHGRAAPRGWHRRTLRRPGDVNPAPTKCRCRAKSSSARDLPSPGLHVLLPLGDRHPTPHPVGFAHRERVLAALLDDRAPMAHLLGLRLPLVTRSAPFTVGREEHRGVDTAAQALHLPVPDIDGRPEGVR